MGQRNEERAIFEQLPLNDFKKWSSTLLNHFKNYTIILTNNSSKLRNL